MKSSLRILYFLFIPSRTTGIILSLFLSGIALSLLLSTLDTESINAVTATKADTFDLSTAQVVYTAVDRDSLVKDSDQMKWQESCVMRQVEISGIGMGNGSTITNPQTLTLANSARVDWLLAQVAGRYNDSLTVPENVTFATNLSWPIILSEPSYDSSQAYSFVTNVKPARQITATVNTTDQIDLTPRGFILYAGRITGEKWTSVGLIKNDYVYGVATDANAHTEVLTFAELATATDLFVTAVVIDNDNDKRPMVLATTAGSVTSSVSVTSPTHGELLNITNLELTQVPAGTNQISVTLESPITNGDSLVLVGLNVSFRCLAPNSPSTYFIYLPLSKKPAHLYLPVNIHKPYLANNECITGLINTRELADELPPLAPDTVYCSDLSDGTVDVFHIDLNMTQTVSITLHNDGVGTFVYTRLLIYKESEKIPYSQCCDGPELTITLPQPNENPLEPGRYYIAVQPAYLPDSSTISYTLMWSTLWSNH